MTRLLLLAGLCLAVSGCPDSAPAPHEGPEVRQLSNAPPAPAPPVGKNDVVATVNGLPITMDELSRPLVNNYGLDVLINLMQFEMARNKAKELQLTVTPDDLKQELNKSLTMLLKSTKEGDFEAMISQLLQQMHITRAAFDVWVQTNAYLRKILEPQLKNAITEQNLHDAFDLLYGATVRVRHIQCHNLQEIAEVQRQLQSGKPFEEVARTLSTDGRSAALGGLLPPFSLQAQSRSKAFKDEAFRLKVGEVSGAIQSGDAYHVIKMEEKISPTAVKFEDPEIKGVVREWVANTIMFTAMQQLRSSFADSARDHIDIRDPVLKEQYQQKIDQHETKIKDHDAALKQIEIDNKNATTRAASQPSTLPALPTTRTTTSAPATAPQVGRPPATLPGH